VPKKSARAPVGLAPRAQIAPRTTRPSARRATKVTTSNQTPAMHARQDSTKTLTSLLPHIARAVAQGSTQHPQVSAKPKSASALMGLARRAQLARRMIPQSARRANMDTT
jgi:hypothetical protein